jgi:hypothetical protein
MSLLELLSQKMPGSCLVRGVLERGFSAERLNELFERHAQDQYTRNLLFSTLCDLLLQVVLGVHPSVHPAHQAREGEMNVSLAALYAKLSGVEPMVLAALVRETASRSSTSRDTATGASASAWPSPPVTGDTVLEVVTDLPETIEAAAVAALYRKRWTVETAFQHLETHLHAEIDTLAYPRAALFGFSLALVAYHVFSLALAALDSAQAEPVSDTLSTYYVGHEIAATFLAVLSLTAPEDWQFLASLSPAEFAGWLRRGAARIHPRKYQKHSRGPKKPRSKVPYDPKQPPVSTQRLLHKRKSHTP